jgi:thioesterase domain-containing protein
VLGKNGFFYRPLAEHLGPDQPLYGLGVTDITGPLDAPTDVDGISDAYCEEILRCAPTGPVTLAAVSMGSIVAIETGRRLIAAGREAPLVVLFDAIGPGDFVPLPRHRWAWLHATRAARNPWRYVTKFIGSRLSGKREQRDLVRAAEDLAAGGELTPEQRFIQFSNANAAAQANYRPEPYPGQVALFLAAEEGFADTEWRMGGMGWQGFVAGDLHVAEVPGEHLSILAEPNVATLAAGIRALLPG